MDILTPRLESLPQSSTSNAPKSGLTNGSAFKEILSGLAQRMDRGEAAVQAALHGSPRLGPAGELLGLQAGVYQYTEMFEVAAKVVDKATSAIKTTLQGQ